MVLKLDGNSGFSTHAWSKKGLFIEKNILSKLGITLNSKVLETQMILYMHAIN